MNTTNFKIAERSKKMLTTALLDIMKQYKYNQITVTQIVQEAGLSRKTFYRLFSDKQEILTLHIEQIYCKFYEQIKQQQLEHYWDVVQKYFDYWQSKKEFLDLLKKNHLLYLLYDTSYQYSFEIFRLVRSNDIADCYADTLPYMLSYSFGGMNSMLLKWIEDDMRIPASLFITQLRKGFQAFNI